MKKTQKKIKVTKGSSEEIKSILTHVIEALPTSDESVWQCKLATRHMIDTAEAYYKASNTERSKCDALHKLEDTSAYIPKLVNQNFVLAGLGFSKRRKDFTEETNKTVLAMDTCAAALKSSMMQVHKWKHKEMADEQATNLYKSLHQLGTALLHRWKI